MEKQRVLIVDDMKEVYDKVRPNLEKRYNVDYAQNEKEALEMIESDDYTKVITDYHLGNDAPKGGLNVIRAAKEKGLEVTLISTENHEQEALEEGADRFIFKKEFFREVNQND